MPASRLHPTACQSWSKKLGRVCLYYRWSEVSKCTHYYTQNINICTCNVCIQQKLFLVIFNWFLCCCVKNMIAVHNVSLYLHSITSTICPQDQFYSLLFTAYNVHVHVYNMSTVRRKVPLVIDMVIKTIFEVHVIHYLKSTLLKFPVMSALIPTVFITFILTFAGVNIPTIIELMRIAMQSYLNTCILPCEKYMYIQCVACGSLLRYKCAL